MKFNTDDQSDRPLVGAQEILDGPVNDPENPLPLRALLMRPAVVSVAKYGVIGLLDIIAEALIPLVWSTFVEFGRLGMSPASIGLWMAGYGLLNGVFQFIALPRIVGHFGPRRVFIASILSFFPVYIMLPFENLASRRSSCSFNPVTALLIVLQFSVISFAEMGFCELPCTLLRCIWSLKWPRIHKAQYLCTYPLLLLTSGLLALQMGLCR